MLKKYFINKKNILKIALYLFIFLTSNKSLAAVLTAGNISTCGELASPGTYTITQNISGGSDTCFYISSDNVIINGGGFTITGTGNVAIDARARTGGPTGSLTGGAHAYTNLIINDLNISGYTTGVNMSGNDDLIGDGVNNGNGGDGGDIAVYYSYLGSIVIDGGDSSNYPTGGLGGNLAINDTDLNISNSLFSSAGGLGILGYGSDGNLILNYTGTLNKTSVSFSKLSLLKDNSSEYFNYPGGTWPISPGDVSSCGTLYGAGTYILTQDLVSSSTCFVIGTDDITIDGSGHSLVSATTTSLFAIDSPNSDNSNLVVKNLNFSNFSNTIGSTSSLSIINSGNVDISNQTINAGSLIIKYIGNFIYSNTLLSNLTSLIINNINYRNYASGQLSAFANNWVEKTSLGTKAWTSVASSADGKYVYATVDSSFYLYKSSDYGNTWNNSTLLGGSNWAFIETSADGKYIILLRSTSAQDMYVSSDYGETWVNKNLGHGYLRSAAISSDGSKMVVVSWDRKVSLSVNYGSTWTIQNSSSYLNWGSIRANGDFSKMVGVAGIGAPPGSVAGYIYTSTDMGATWATSTSAGLRYWKDVDMSADGSKMFAVTNNQASSNGYIYTSTDGGSTWATSTSAGLRNWRDLEITPDGKKIVAPAYNDHVYVSTDSGATWATSTLSLGTKTWSYASMSLDGSRLFAVANLGSIFTFLTLPVDLYTSIISPVSNENVQEWKPFVSWGAAAECYYSYDNWTSSSTANCSLNGSDISQPDSAGNKTLYIRSYGKGSAIDKSVSFSYVGQTINIITPSVLYLVHKNSNWAPSVDYDMNNNLNLTSCYYSYDNWTSSSTANCSLNGSDILPPTSEGYKTLYIRTVDDQNNTYNSNRSFNYEIDYWSEISALNENTTNWFSIAVTDDDNRMIGVSYSGYIYTTSNGGATWATSTNAGQRNWTSVAASSDGVKIVATVSSGHIYISNDGGVTWATSTNAIGTKNWYAVTSSADGTKLAAAVDNGYIYTSTDGGATWATSTNAGSRSWKSIISTSDGTKLAAAVWGGYIYISTDSGATWTEKTSLGARLWYDLSMSSDGVKLAAVVSGGYIYTSIDGGANWTEKTSVGTKSWRYIDSTPDGSKLIAAVPNGYIYTSIDSGANWTERQASGIRNWQGAFINRSGSRLIAFLNSNIYLSDDGGIYWYTKNLTKSWRRLASSADGTKLVGVSQGEYIYTSTDSGNTWIPRTGLGTKTWYGISSSADGTKLAAAVYGGYIYTSTDSGVTWATSTNSGSRNWNAISSSADGSKLAAVHYGGYIYIYLPIVVQHGQHQPMLVLGLGNI